MINVGVKRKGVVVGFALLALTAVFLLFFLANRPKGKGEMATGTGTGAEAKAEVGIAVDLTPVYNCSTSHSIFRKFPTDNLGSFPIGTNGFGGIRFVVGGMIQLGGSFPKEALGIEVSAKAKRVCLLHGTAGFVREGTKIAMLVIHYDQGDPVELPIQYGVHVRDWWMWNPNESPYMGPDTEAVWEGENELSKSKKCRIRIYASRFENPAPERLIKTIDYIRARTSGGTTPFMLGLTVD